MEIRILLFLFLLTLVTNYVNAGKFRLSSRSSLRGSSSRSSSSRSSSSHSFSNLSSPRFASSSGGHRGGSTSAGSSSQTLHQQNKDASTSILHAERGAIRPPLRNSAQPSGQSSVPYGNSGTYPGRKPDLATESKQNAVPYNPSAPSAPLANHLPKTNAASSQNHAPTSFGQSNAPYNPSHGTVPNPPWSNPHFHPRPPIAPSTDHLSKTNVAPSQNHAPTSFGQPNAPYNPSYGTAHNPSWSNPHFHPNPPYPTSTNIGFKDHLRPTSIPNPSYNPVPPYPRTNYPVSATNPHSPPYPIHPSSHPNQPHSIPTAYNPSHSVPGQTSFPIGHPSSYPAHIPPPVPGTFGNPYSTHPVGGTYGPGYYPQQHVMAQPAAQPYIPGQTVITVPGQQDSGRGFGQMVKEALVFSTINAGVNRLINPHHHYVPDYNRPASTGASTSETHVTYNNNYFNTPPASPNVNPQENVPVAYPVMYPSPVNNPVITPGVSIPTIVGNNSGITYPNNNGSLANRMDTTNNLGGSPTGFSAGNTVNDRGGSDQETNVYSSRYKISDNDLSMLTEELFAKQEVNISKYLTLYLQNKSENMTDAALGPLIYAQPEVYDYPTILVTRALYDNYEHNSTVKENQTLEKRKKEDLLLDVFLNTNILTRTMEWLSHRGFIDPDDFEKKDTLRRIWFNQFNGATSGFERVFTSERYGADLLGVQDWLYFEYQESKGRINYMGYVNTLKLGDKASLLKLNLKMDDIIRPNATIFVGTLPELEMSLYTICFYARPNDLCPVSLGGTKFNIFTHSFRYYGKDLIDLALPIF